MAYALSQRPPYRDMTWRQARDAGFDIAQLKYDGRLAFLQFNGEGRYTIHSRTGSLDEAGQALTSMKRHIIVAENLIGTNWSMKPERHGKLIAFDMLMCAGEDIRERTYDDRFWMLTEFLRATYSWKLLALNGRLEITKSCSVLHAPNMWNMHVEKHDYEGLVFRRSTDPWGGLIGRQKREVEVDYIILGTVPSESDTRAGCGIKAFRLGLRFGDEVREVAQVGSMTRELYQDAYLRPERYIGRVITVRGKALFPSGALRHPSVVRLRDDKQPADCSLPSSQDNSTS